MKKRLFAGMLCVMASFAMPAFGAGDPAAGKTKSAVCAACHGPEGVALIAEYPNLSGQGEAYLLKQLKEFKEGGRENALMSPMAMPLSDQDMEDLSAYYASLPANEGVAPEGDLELGENIYRGGITSAQIPACIGCHGPSGNGNPMAKYPAISGQNASYTVLTLKEFRNSVRHNDPNKMMRAVAHRMSDAEIEAVSKYIQGLH